MADNSNADETASLKEIFSALSEGVNSLLSELWNLLSELWNYPISWVGVLQGIGIFILIPIVAYIVFLLIYLEIKLGMILWDLMQIAWLLTKRRLGRSSTLPARKL